MTGRRLFLVYSVVLFLFITGCATFRQAPMQVDPGTVLPGTKVTRGGNEVNLLGSPIAIGMKLPATELIDAMTMQEVDLTEAKGKVLMLSIVPSIDTKVCEAQTHLLGEEGDRISPEIMRITISRDTPFAQKRFAENAKLTDIDYLSDYKEGAFGYSLGLLMDGPRLLARSVILVDKKGIVRYIQVVPEVSNLPEMEKAFDKAQELVQE
jgi:thiol peroxidase